jgi:hypothetical protein
MIISALIIGAILVIVSATNTSSSSSDQTPLPQNLIAHTAVPIPTPPIADVQPIPSETPIPFSGVTSEPSVIPIPVPTPPSQ